MKNINVFSTKGKWYKGNLHCHSNISDGVLSPPEVIEIYRARGYSFLSMTDHSILTDLGKYNTADFLLLPGVEAETNVPETAIRYHIIGFGEPKLRSASDNSSVSKSSIPFPPVEWKGIQSAQSIINGFRNNSMCVILCHPVWSRLEPEDMLKLADFTAIEIYNYCAELENHTGICTLYWDLLLRRGFKVWGMATDDAHHVLDDHCGGWIVVKAEEFSTAGILNAIQHGVFYSSNGPEIYSFGINNNQVHISCSHVKAIHFVAYDVYGRSFFSKNNDYLTEAEYEISENEIFIRAECIDEYGNTAWTNPIFIKNNN